MLSTGDMVTEILWHLYSLEKQAARAGGMVHYILGNHELMVLDEDLRYINEKYKQVEAISGIKYSDLYSENSVLGKWLRSKPVMVTINNIIFVHRSNYPSWFTETWISGISIRHLVTVSLEGIYSRGK